MSQSHRFPSRSSGKLGLDARYPPGRSHLEVATPAELKMASRRLEPEDLVVRRPPPDYAMTLLAVAEGRRLTLLDLQVDGTGHVEHQQDARFRFVAIELVAAKVAVEPEQVESAEKPPAMPRTPASSASPSTLLSISRYSSKPERSRPYEREIRRRADLRRAAISPRARGGDHGGRPLSRVRRADAPLPAWSPARPAWTSPGFIGAIAAGDPDAAARTIFAENLLGATCAASARLRSCARQLACCRSRGRRADRDRRASAVRDRLALETGRADPRARPSERPRVAVVGAGPAGSVCAGELASRGYPVTVFDGERRSAASSATRSPLSAGVRTAAAGSGGAGAMGVEFRLGTRIAQVSSRSSLRNGRCLPRCRHGPRPRVSYPGDELPASGTRCRSSRRSRPGAPPEVGRASSSSAAATPRSTSPARRSGSGQSVTLVYRRGEAEMPAYPRRSPRPARRGPASSS